MEWYGAKTVYVHDDLAARHGKPCYEERVVVLQASSAEEAIASAEIEAKNYAEGLDQTRYLGFVNVFHLYDAPGEGKEVYSIMRSLELDEEKYLDQYYDDGFATPALDLLLRDVAEGDLPRFFDHQLDATANHMAAFTSKDPTDVDAHRAHWNRLLNDQTIRKQTILWRGRVAGHIASYDQAGKREVTYWIDPKLWGKGLASRALAEFLQQESTRPLYARAAKDNAASIRVLQKCGFTICGVDIGFANARGLEVEVHILILPASV